MLYARKIGRRLDWSNVVGAYREGYGKWIN